jgi:hypothetical protein
MHDSGRVAQWGRQHRPRDPGSRAEVADTVAGVISALDRGPVSMAYNLTVLDVPGRAWPRSPARASRPMGKMTGTLTGALRAGRPLSEISGR